MPAYVARSQGEDSINQGTPQMPTYRPPLGNLAPIIHGQPVYLPAHKRHGPKAKVNRGGVQAYNKAYWKLSRLGKLQPGGPPQQDLGEEAAAG